MLGKHLLAEAKFTRYDPAKIYDKNGELVKTLDNGQRACKFKRRAENG